MKHSIGLTLAAGVETEVMVVPAGYKAEVNTMFVSNNVGNNKAVTVYWKHGHDPLHKIYIVTGYVISANNYLMFQDSMVMQEGDSIHIATEAATAMSCIVSFDLRKEAKTVAFDGE